jgi:hypothetical protein
MQVQLFAAFLCASVSVLPGFGGELPEAHQLFSGHFHAAGGREFFETNSTLDVSGVIEEDGSSRVFRMRCKAPGMILFEGTDGSGKALMQGRDNGARFWEKNRSELDPKARRALGELSLVMFPAGLNGLAEGLGEAVVERDRANGRAVFATGRRNARRTFSRLYFDVDTGLLQGIGHTRCIAYTEADGLRLPSVVCQNGIRTYRIESVKLNVPLEGKLFENPNPRGGWVSSAMPTVIPDFRLGTNLSAAGQLQIVRRPAAGPIPSRRLTSVPVYDPESGRHAQVDLRGADLSHVKQAPASDLRHADFDSKTVWPDELPAGFDPGAIMELGKDPGLNVRALHEQGITGEGIGIGVIDMALLTDHSEYADRLRLYEEIHAPATFPAHMHGCAVASIALGKHIGVAPRANLYFIAVQNSSYTAERKVQIDFAGVAAGIHRLLDINETLTPPRKIRVISLSVGWSPGQRGYQEAMQAVERGTHQGVFVLSTVLRNTHGLRFDGLGREAMADPNHYESYGPGSWWANRFWGGDLRFKPGTRLCVPMDGRTTASPSGPNDYVHYDNSGWSWAVPWIAGLYALACEVQPEITPEVFWAKALSTGRNIRLHGQGEDIEFGTLADPVALISELRKSPLPWTSATSSRLTSAGPVK